VISADGIKPDETKLEAIKCIDEPKNTKELKSFLGLISYYRKYIRGCAQIAQPLTKLLKKDHKFQWNNEHKTAFNNLKQKLLEKPILAHPDFSKGFVLQTDASLDGIGAVLSQINNSAEHPIAFASRTLRPAEKHYPITELETLSVVEFVKFFRPYLYLNDVIVQTDHTAVKAVLEKPNPSARIARWGLALAGTNLDIQPRKGSKHGNADALSRLPNKQAKPCFDIETDSYSRPQESINSNIPQQLDIHKCQRNELTHIFKEINDDPHQTQYKIIHELVYRNVNNDMKLVVPPSLCKIVISAYHDDPLTGHFSARKTMKAISQKYFWPCLQRDVERYVNNCKQCQINKPTRHKIKATLKPISVNKPFERLAVDCMGPLPLTLNGNRYLVVFIDYFSKYIESFPTIDITAETIAKLFVTKIICRHGAPEILQSDRGSDFTAKLMQEITKLMNVRQSFTTAYHPISNGEVERANQTLTTRIRMFVSKNQDDWDEHVPYATFSTNIHENSSTGYSPFELLFGRKPLLPVDRALQYQLPSAFIDLQTYDSEVKRHFTQALNIIPKEIEASQAKYGLQYNKKANNAKYRVKDLILKERQAVKKGLIQKLGPIYDGPYQIERIDYPNITIKLLSDPSKIETVHVNRTKAYKTNEIHEKDRSGENKAVAPKHPKPKQIEAPKPQYNLRPRIANVEYINYDWLNNKMNDDSSVIMFTSGNHQITGTPPSSDIESDVEHEPTVSYRRQWDYVYGGTQTIPLDGFVPGCFGKYSSTNAEPTADSDDEPGTSTQKKAAKDDPDAARRRDRS